MIGIKTTKNGIRIVAKRFEKTIKIDVRRSGKLVRTIVKTSENTPRIRGRRTGSGRKTGANTGRENTKLKKNGVRRPGKNVESMKNTGEHGVRFCAKVSIAAEASSGSFRFGS